MNANVINWKELSKSVGYKKLKAEWIKSRMSSKHRFYSEWKFIFGLLKKVCIKHDLDSCNVLNIWEEDRGYWFPNYYQKCNERRLEKLALATIE